jgi:uncharacterized protein YqgC (DUF456 family)
MENTVVGWVIAVGLILAGVAGLVLPGLPGAPVMFAGLWMAAWVEDFQYVGAGTLAVLGVLAGLTYVVDFAATAFGAKRFGASKNAIIGAGVGMLLGLFIGFPGIVLGPFIGAMAAELLGRRNLQAATRAGMGATVGLALGVALKLALAFSMLGIFVVMRLL